MSYEVKKDWTTSAGLRAVVIMGRLGHHCGYVGVPKDNPLHGVGYSQATPALKLNINRSTEKMSPAQVLCSTVKELDELNSPEYVFEVHGGLTYSGGKDTYPVPSDLWWFGYDCGHGGDSPSPEYQEQQRQKYPNDVFMWRKDIYSTFRDIDYCIAECESLASQIVKATNPVLNTNTDGHDV